ncbi:conjugative transposon protein TraN [Spirosoma sp.]|uniref:conjugative transposon protein TraN n=1 Tax=Spirosoma sp. TaxID=1899569 RepID=UPI00262665CF|nr:conjugative transposon protein TraN [Spirosoma sp.]MCX6213758.1 conjugative transposon protein TraN [Spirosoma sp.]
MNAYFFRPIGLIYFTSISLLVTNGASAQSAGTNRPVSAPGQPATVAYATGRPFRHTFTAALPSRGLLTSPSASTATAPVKKPTTLAGATPSVKLVKPDTLPSLGTPKVVPSSSEKRFIAAPSRSDTKSVSARSPVPEADDQAVPASQIDDTPLAEMTIVNNNAHALRVPAIPIRDYNVVKSYYTELPYNKTISIIFPTPIKSVDLGSRDIIADKASDVENVLKVKASKVGFNETNFSVITTDGKFYSFVANYNEQPALLALNLAMNTMGSEGPARVGGSREDSEEFINGLNAKDGVIQFSGIRASASEVVYNCDQVNHKRRTIRHLGVSENLMEATIRGFYVKDNVMYVKLQLKNKSNINYDIDYMRFFIVDKTIAKRTTFQETEIVPFYVHNDGIRVIPGHQKMEQVLAFQKFTIPDNKRILVQINEAGGGRALTFLMNNEDIMNSGKL